MRANVNVQVGFSAKKCTWATIRLLGTTSVYSMPPSMWNPSRCVYTRADVPTPSGLMSTSARPTSFTFQSRSTSSAYSNTDSTGASIVMLRVSVVMTVHLLSPPSTLGLPIEAL